LGKQVSILNKINTLTWFSFNFLTYFNVQGGNSKEPEGPSSPSPEDGEGSVSESVANCPAKPSAPIFGRTGCLAEISESENDTGFSCRSRPLTRCCVVVAYAACCLGRWCWSKTWWTCACVLSLARSVFARGGDGLLL